MRRGINYDCTFLQQSATTSKKRGNTEIEAVRYFCERWMKHDTSFTVKVEAEEESRVCSRCKLFWTGNILDKICPECSMETVDTGPIGVH